MGRLPDEIVVTNRVRIPAAELDISFARSSGPGGQHVNKTSSKVLLRWNPRTSGALTAADLALLEERLAARLTTDGDLLVASERYRDQGRNAEDAVERMATLVREAIRRPTPRKKTKPSRAARKRRVDDKRRQGQKKRDRRAPPE